MRGVVRRGLEGNGNGQSSDQESEKWTQKGRVGHSEGKLNSVEARAGGV